MENVVLSFGVLGPLTLERDGRPVRLPRSNVLRALLGALLLAEGVPLSADHLVELVWAGRGGRGVVHVGISRLRGWLAPLAGDGPGEGGEPVAAVELGDGGYRLTVDPRAGDLPRFRALLARARAEPDPAARCRLLGRAMELSRGPVLADVALLDPAGPLLCQAAASVRAGGLALADAALAAGRPAQALRPLEALAADPLDEPVHARVLELLAASGRPAEALTRYETLRQRLAEDLGVNPSSDLQRAHAAILAADREIGVAGTAGAVAGTAGSAGAAGVRPCLLPADIGDFSGREAQVRYLLETLAHRDGSTAVPVAAVAGRAGTGKTTLATHVAHRLRTRYPDGQLYVDLHGTEVIAPADVLGRFLAALGLAARAIPDGLDRRVELFRALLTDRRVLVVLDDAASDQQVLPLLPGVPTCAVLVTGRRRLAALSARHLHLDVLEPRAALALLAGVAGPERVAAEPAAAAAIVRLCGYLPLAVRITGARLAARPHWPLSRLAERMAGERWRPADPRPGLVGQGGQKLMFLQPEAELLPTPWCFIARALCGPYTPSTEMLSADCTLRNAEAVCEP